MISVALVRIGIAVLLLLVVVVVVVTEKGMEVGGRT
jgi:hypothetical protein